MPITMNSFTCPNGHAFEANAKLRARCPQCGASTKRAFTTPAHTAPKPAPIKTEAPKPKIGLFHKKLKVEVKPDPKPKVAVPVLVRQGRPRVTVKTHVVEEPVAPKKAAPKAKLPAKRTLIGSKVSGGLVKTHTVKQRGIMPTIKRRPVKTAVARGIQGHEQRRPFWHDVADKYGF